MKLDKKEKNRLAQAKFRSKNPELCRKRRREWKERENKKYRSKIKQID